MISLFSVFCSSITQKTKTKLLKNIIWISFKSEMFSRSIVELILFSEPFNLIRRSQFRGCRPMHVTFLCKTFFFSLPFVSILPFIDLHSLMTTRKFYPFHFTATDQFRIAHSGIWDWEQIFKKPLYCILHTEKYRKTNNKTINKLINCSIKHRVSNWLTQHSTVQQFFSRLHSIYYIRRSAIAFFFFFFR